MKHFVILILTTVVLFIAAIFALGVGTIVDNINIIRPLKPVIISITFLVVLIYEIMVLSNKL